MRESAVEKYLKKQVRLAGGTTRKQTGYIHAPDQLVIWPVPATLPRRADIHMVETKAPGKKARAGQLREHKRLRALGVTAIVIDTKEKVDAYLRNR